MSDIISLKNIHLNYGHLKALSDISGNFKEGSLTAIAGPNGAGKSTLLKIIAGVIKPSAGHVLMNQQTQIAYLPQITSLQKDFPINVLQVVCTGLFQKIGLHAKITPEMLESARSALQEVGLSGFETRQISELSGGEFQRMLFARLIIQDAKVILLDEPFAAIDASTTAKLIQIILRWHKEGRTIICVLHDLMLIQKYFPHSFVLAGKCLGSGHTHELFEQKLLSFDLDMAELCPGEDEGGRLHKTGHNTAIETHAHGPHCTHEHHH